MGIKNLVRRAREIFKGQDYMQIPVDRDYLEATLNISKNISKLASLPTPDDVVKASVYFTEYALSEAEKDNKVARKLIGRYQAEAKKSGFLNGYKIN